MHDSEEKETIDPNVAYMLAYTLVYVDEGKRKGDVCV
jgi:hypothetical protein